MIHVAMSSCQETIDKWMRDGMTKAEAERKLEAIMRCKLPELIRCTVKK